MNKQFSLLGQHFSSHLQVGHEFEQQWTGNLRSAVRRMCVKIECGWFCKPNKGQSQTTDENLPVLPQEQYLFEKEFGPMLNQGNILSPIVQCRRNWFIFFVMEVTLEKILERLNFEESKTIVRNVSCIVLIGLTTSGRKAWEEEDELFKVIQDAVSLILLLDRTHKDPETADLGAPRHAQHMHIAWKKFHNTVSWVDIKIVLKKWMI